MGCILSSKRFEGRSFHFLNSVHPMSATPMTTAITMIAINAPLGRPLESSSFLVDSAEAEGLAEDDLRDGRAVELDARVRVDTGVALRVVEATTGGKVAADDAPACQLGEVRACSLEEGSAEEEDGTAELEGADVVDATELDEGGGGGAELEGSGALVVDASVGLAELEEGTAEDVGRAEVGAAVDEEGVGDRVVADEDDASSSSLAPGIGNGNRSSGSALLARALWWCRLCWWITGPAA